MFNKILIQPLFNLLMLIYAVIPGHDFGVAIIIMTVIVRLALWPLLASQLRSQKKLQDLQPEVARVRKEAKGDKQLESRMLMELYKEREINPFASLIPLLVQLPLFLALFVVLRDVIKPGEIEHLIYPALSHLPAIKDVIAHPDSFKPELLGIIDLTKPSIFLAITAAAAQWYQTKQLLPKTPSDDPQAKVMASTSKIFPVLTGLIALRLPSALALYWTVASLVAIGQQWWLLREDVEDLETAEDKKKAKKTKKLAAGKKT